MTDLATFRQKYPQYDDMSDEALAQALHKKFYSDMDYGDFSARIGLQSQESQVSQPEERPGTIEYLRRGAEGIVNDINAGLQGVNPVAVQQTKPVGRIIKSWDGKEYVEIGDGHKIPASDYLDTGDFITARQDGQVYLYPRTEDMAAGPLESAGRMLGYGVLSSGMKAASPKPPTPRQEAARAAGDLGITPTAGMLGRGAAQIGGLMERSPISSGVMARGRNRVVGEIEGALEGATAKIGQASDNLGAGAALRRGGETFKTGFKTKSAKLYDAVDAKIPRGTKVAAVNAAEEIRRTLETFKGTPNISAQAGVAKWTKIADELDGGKLTWEALKEYRGAIRRAIEGKGDEILGSTDTGRLKAIYAQLTEDMGAAADVAGAGKEWRRANAYYKAGAERLKSAFDKVLGENIAPEKAYNDAIALIRAGSSRADIAKFNKIRKSLPPDEWGEFAATVIRRMGDAGPGAQGAAGDSFSPAVFLTNWNKTSKEGRALLASGALDGGAKYQLDQLAKVVERFKSAERETAGPANRSAEVISAMLAGSFIDTGATLAVAGGNWLTAKAMTNPRFLRALNRAARGDNRGLRDLAGSDSPLALEAATVLRLTLSPESAQAQAAAGAPTPPAQSR